MTTTLTDILDAIAFGVARIALRAMNAYLGDEDRS